jgi:HTH-type transcriptional regulator, sugar sensing transcriptional regulator
MNPTDSLQQLGLTPMEALAYTYLVANPSATGYRVARGVGKPTANVYRALESLERKGAVIRDRSTAPLFRALAPQELLGQLEREFAQRKASAARELASLHAEKDDDRLYSLGTTAQVMDRARRLLTSARRIVLADVPGILAEKLAGEIEQARTRGTRVLVIAGGRVDPLRLRMVADGREALLADLSPDATRVRDALWTQSAVFAVTIHDALTTELFFLEVGRGVAEGLSVDEVEQAFERCREVRDGIGA